MHLQVATLLLAILQLLGLCASFSPLGLNTRSHNVHPKSPRHLVQLFMAQPQNEEKDWLVEMEQQSYEALRQNKEPLYDHDDWVEYRKPDRRLNDTFDFAFPAFAAFVLWFCYAAVSL